MHKINLVYINYLGRSSYAYNKLASLEATLVRNYDLLTY